MLQARVDKNLCVGCRLCIELCPAVFVRSEDGTAYSQLTDIPAEERQSCQEAADACPVDAIKVAEVPATITFDVKTRK